MSTLDIIKQILDNQMDMPQGRVFAYNSNVDLPKDEHLFIVLHYAQKTPYYNNNEYKTINGEFVEHQRIGLKEDIVISCISKNLEARERVHEVALALNSIYSQTVQEANKMHITTISNITDNSFAEASSRLNRFDVRTKIFASYDKIKNIDYYDKYSGSIWSNDETENVTKTDIPYNEE